MSQKPAVFRDSSMQHEFDQKGFVKFRLFNDEQINRIRDFYLHTQHEHETIINQKKFHATNETNNPELIAASDQFIKQVMLEEVDKHFKDYQVIAANYLIKQSSEDSELGPHQDLRFVDESRFYSFNIWVATEATNRLNGGLRFIKGSHLWHDTVRTLPSYPWRYRSIYDELLTGFSDIETQPGECVVLNHACIHGSYPNLSGKRRIAAILAMIPAEADIRHYFLPDSDPENEVEEYAMSLQDFITLKVGHRPENAQLIQKFKYDFSAVEVGYFRKGAASTKPQQANNNLYEQFKQRLSALLGFVG